jgi:hypothetical protein
MRLALIVGFLLLIAACAVRHESPDGIIIEHDVYQPELATVEAQKHCDEYGKQAVLVKTTAPAPSASLFYLDSSVSVFDCVAK